MKTKAIPPFKPSKEEREMRVLLGLIEQYIATGKPVGSNTLKEEGFNDLSSATIRNYFAKLEEEGYLDQLHASGGRIPSEKAWRWYIDKLLAEKIENQEILFPFEGVEINSFLQEALEWLSKKVGAAAFLSSPRFDQDFILAIKPVSIDSKRLLFVCITHFGQVFTEILAYSFRHTTHVLLRFEKYFSWRLASSREEERPLLEDEEQQVAEELYQELMLRYIVHYANFSESDLYRCGFSHLLHHEELRDPTVLASALSLFENKRGMRHLLRETMSKNQLQLFLGEDLLQIQKEAVAAALITAPYHIGPKTVGAIALLGPMRVPYKEWIKTLTQFTASLSKALTQMIYKYEISYRMPDLSGRYLPYEPQKWLEDASHFKLIEDKGKK